MVRERAIHLRIRWVMLQAVLRRSPAQAAAPMTPATDAVLTRRRVYVMLHSCTPQRLCCWWAELLPRVLKLRDATYLRCLFAVCDNNADRYAGDDVDVAADQPLLPRRFKACCGCWNCRTQHGWVLTMQL